MSSVWLKQRSGATFAAIRLYFTELNGAAVYRIDAPGKLTRILAVPDFEPPNGIQISPDDKKLYPFEANPAQGGARMIRSHDLQPDGTARNMRLYHLGPKDRRLCGEPATPSR